MKSLFEHTVNVTIFIVGLFDGSDHQNWYQPDKAHVYAWEILEKKYSLARRRLQRFPEVEIYRGAVSASEGELVNVSGMGEAAGIYMNLRACPRLRTNQRTSPHASVG